METDRYRAEVGYGITGSLRVSLGAELLDWGPVNSAANGGRTFGQWYDVGLGYSLAQNARLSFLWLFSSSAPGAPQSPSMALGAGRSSTSLVSTQLSIKF
jgi:hypothetical protein